MRIPLLGGAYEGISTNTSSQECINFYYEKPAPGESHEGALLPVHGATLFATLANAGDIRGLLYNPIDNLLYIVSDNDFYEVTSAAAGVSVAVGTLSSTSGHVQMALNPSNGEILIVDGTEGRLYDVDTNTMSTVSDADFPDTANCAVFLNGYFLVNAPSTPGRVQFSTLNNGASWVATDIFTAESMRSAVIAMLEDRGVLWLLGDTNGELWYNQGDADFVFARFERIDVGCAARMTLQKFDNSVVWLARSERGELTVVRAGNQYQPEVISTPELSRTWHQYSAVTDAFAYTYSLDGHEFYVLTFPTGNATFAYDASTQKWHQRSGPFSSSEPTRELTNCLAFCSAWGAHIAGDYQENGRLYALHETTYTWNSVNMERRVTGPMMAADNESQLRFSEVQVDIEEGVATGGESGDDGQLRLNYSKDGGHTYSTGVLLNLGVGSSTGYATRVVKRKLGHGRLWNFRVYTDTPRKIIIKGAFGRVFGEPLGGYSRRAK